MIPRIAVWQGVYFIPDRRRIERLMSTFIVQLIWKNVHAVITGKHRLSVRAKWRRNKRRRLQLRPLSRPLPLRGLNDNVSGCVYIFGPDSES